MGGDPPSPEQDAVNIDPMDQFCDSHCNSRQVVIRSSSSNVSAFEEGEEVSMGLLIWESVPEHPSCSNSLSWASNLQTVTGATVARHGNKLGVGTTIAPVIVKRYSILSLKLWISQKRLTLNPKYVALSSLLGEESIISYLPFLFLSSNYAILCYINHSKEVNNSSLIMKQLFLPGMIRRSPYDPSVPVELKEAFETLSRSKKQASLL